MAVLMHEQIRANRRSSVLLILAVAAILPLLGLAIGNAIDPAGAMPGLGMGTLLLVILLPMALMGGNSMLLHSAGAHEITKEDSQVLFNVVEEMTIAAGLPKRPRIYIMDCDAPNAFAVGAPENSALAVTSGLLMRLDRDELQGVVAHEIGHIKNEDSRFMTLAAVLVGAAIILSDIFVRGFSRSPGRRRSGGSGRGGKAQGVLVLVALLFIILAPLLARLLYFACSRRREYLADACAAWYTRYPAGLASALEKIQRGTGAMGDVNRALVPLFIVNPVSELAGSGPFSTHPATAERVRILRSMEGGAGLAAYEKASTRVSGRPVLGAGNITGAPEASLREPDRSQPDKPPLERARQAVNILHHIAGTVFIPCACGVSLKVPRDFDAGEVRCPRCGAAHSVSAARAAAAAPVPAAPGVIKYVPGRWQTFRCGCGNALELSPSYMGQRVQCPRCKAVIQTARAEQ